MYAVEMAGITKKFSGVKAVDNVDFRVKLGEIHALVGENGAGKSTLMKVLAGSYSTTGYKGRIFINGAEKRIGRPRDAMEAGVVMVHQELALIEELSVAENLFLGNYPGPKGFADRRKMNRMAKEALEQMNLRLDPRVLIRKVGVGQQQLVEIAKSIIRGGKLLILDEPTAPLTETEIKYLFGLLRDLKSKGISIIYISHRMEEIFEISDSITVMRDGVIVNSFATAQTDQHEIVSSMIGRELTDFYPKDKTVPGCVTFSIRDYSVANAVYPERDIVKHVNMDFREGEIVGISGLLGSGRTELMSAVMGVYPCKGRGCVRVFDKEVAFSNPRKAISQGIGFLTEDRKRSGLILGEKISTNITLSCLPKVSRRGFLQGRKEQRLVNALVERLRIKTDNPANKVSSLSGGNQQKVVFAKWLAIEPKIFILDEPTRGVDVNAKFEIYTIMKELAKENYTIVMISSDLPEVIGISDRVYVMHEGKVSGELKKEELSEKAIMDFAVGIDSARREAAI